MVRPLKPVDLIAEAERCVLDRYAPAWVLVNQSMDIVQFRGPTGNYITPASGQPSWNLMKMLRVGLVPDVRALIHSALKQNEGARKKGLKVKSGGLLRTVDVETTPITPTGVDPHCLVLFLEHVPPAKEREKKSSRKSQKAREIEDLRRELATTHHLLQTTIEDQNAVNEEMQT